MKTLITDGIKSLLFSLYPTFKEWKLSQKWRIKWRITPVYILPLRNENNKPLGRYDTQSPQRLYPTFKEWKPDTDATTIRQSDCLYPTFKEWKLLYIVFYIIVHAGVYILPLRNEN